MMRRFKFTGFAPKRMPANCLSSSLVVYCIGRLIFEKKLLGATFHILSNLTGFRYVFGGPASVVENTNNAAFHFLVLVLDDFSWQSGDGDSWPVGRRIE